MCNEFNDNFLSSIKHRDIEIIDRSVNNRRYFNRVDIPGNNLIIFNQKCDIMSILINHQAYLVPG